MYLNVFCHKIDLCPGYISDAGQSAATCPLSPAGASVFREDQLIG